MTLWAEPELPLSQTGLKVAQLVSKRPRTLEELADAAGVSIQAVLKHLGRLEKLGLVRARQVRRGTLAVKKLYYPGEASLEGFSTGEFMVVRRSERPPWSGAEGKPLDAMERLAEDAIVQRARVEGEARRLAKSLDALVAQESMLGEILEHMSLDDVDRAALYVAFTEDTREEAARVLSKFYGIVDARRSIDRALAKARRHAEK
jgi:DNA-binding transcriptional ArsR family regulator